MGQITVGKYLVLFDDVDFNLIFQYKWRICKRQHTNYALTTIKGKSVHMHQLIKHSYDEDIIHDHIDNNGLNNHRANIQLITQAQNCQRRRPNNHSNTPHYKGVSYIASRDKYQATIQVDGLSRNLGRFNSVANAVLAYNEASVKYFGKFAYQNKVRPEDYNYSPSVSECTATVPETGKEE